MLLLSIFLLLVQYVHGGVLDDFTCFDDPKVITYTNSDNQPELPQVRIMQCGYSSQCALNFAAYLFMKEKLGMNVTLYPTEEYDNVWAGEYWDNWNGSLAYPRNYFEWLKGDHMDLNFEFWGTQLVRTNYDGTVSFDGRNDYVLPGHIVMSYSGCFGEESIWMPQYYVEQDPYSIVPSKIRDNAELREKLMNATKNGPTNYNELYNTSSAYDRTNESRPIVWGSATHYFMTQYAYDLINNSITGGLNVSFVTTGGEGSLAALVRDLYSQQVPFLANIYTIDDNFGIIENYSTNGELQQFEKVAVERNPDQSLYDPCFLDKRCQYPVAPILKAANPRLEATYPEAFDFFNNFQLGNRQLSKIVSNYWKYKDNNNVNGYTGSQLWLNAVCDWLKSNETESVATWNNSFWLVDVEREECLNGCGVEATDGDLVGQDIGGHCNYYVGECVCHYDELFADQNCSSSCPGLQGPFWNGSDYSFEWCSNHGLCDTLTRQCACEKGYGGTGCEIEYSKYTLSVGLQVVVVLFSCILAIACIVCIVWLQMSKEYKTVKALSVTMTTIMTVGLLMLACSNIASAMPVSSPSCIAWQFLFGLGGIMAIMSPLLKAYRVSRVFHGGKMLRAVKITDKMLLATLLKCALVEFVICVAYAVLHEVNGGTVISFNDDELRKEAKCNDNQLTQYTLVGSLGFFFIMLCALTKYSYGTRRALSVFKESTCAYFSSFLSLFCALIVVVFYMATPDPTFRTAIQTFAVIIVVTAVLALFYGTRIYTFYTEPDNRNVTEARPATAASSASSSMMKPGPQSSA